MRPIILFIVLISSLSITLAQSEVSSLIFVWKDAIYSLPLDGSQMIHIGIAGDGFDTLITSSDVYTLDASPLSDLPI